jgi:hypothetical protein
MFIVSPILGVIEGVYLDYLPKVAGFVRRINKNFFGIGSLRDCWESTCDFEGKPNGTGDGGLKRRFPTSQN